MWAVSHFYSTGSSWDGTRRHVWRAREVRPSELKGWNQNHNGDVYQCRGAAEEAARELTERNVQP